jgi:hypothetical protein
MNRYLKSSLLFCLISLASCNKDAEIKRLLNSNSTTEVIEGAREAGNTHNKIYVPLLLQKANDPSASTSLRYDGFTVYTEVMFALEEIFKVKPPHRYKDILTLPDSININFYKQLWRNNNKTKVH